MTLSIVQALQMPKLSDMYFVKLKPLRLDRYSNSPLEYPQIFQQMKIFLKDHRLKQLTLWICSNKRMHCSILRPLTDNIKVTLTFKIVGLKLNPDGPEFNSKLKYFQLIGEESVLSVLNVAVIKIHRLFLRLFSADELAKCMYNGS